MDALNNIWASQEQQVIVALEVVRMIGKAFAAEVGFTQAVLLDHGTHGTIEYKDTLP